MKTINHFYENLEPLKSLTSKALKDDILFFDIETTGLSKVKNHIYLIGCGYYTDKGLNIIQWFAENENEEVLVINEFLGFSSSFKSLVNYNGKTFDIPFTTERAKKYGLSFPEFESIDIYNAVKPLKKILSLSDTTQKTVEAFLGIKRTDKYNGGELIYVYQKYVKNALMINSRSVEIKSSSPEFQNVISEQEINFDKLILHNLEDVLNMHYISEITAYSELIDTKVSFSSYEINNYTDYYGNTKEELIIYGEHTLNLPKTIKSFYSDESGLSYLLIISDNGNISVRLPIVKKCLKYFISNYKDYYYLINEDICVYKTMASGVSKENRKNATKENCYTKYNGCFVPLKCSKQFRNELSENEILATQSIHIFKESYKSKMEYIRLDEITGFSNEILSCYLNSLVESFK